MSELVAPDRPKRAPRPRFSAAELAIVAEIFPTLGAKACAERLPGRPIASIRMCAWRLGLSDPTTRGLCAAPSLSDDDAQQVAAWRREGLSFAKIGARLGVSEQTASNAWNRVACLAAGGTPAKRDGTGALLAREVKRMRAMMMQGMKNCDIALQMAVSAAQVTNQRRKYEAELRAKRKGKTLPPPGGGRHYSGRKVPADERKRVEELLLTGLGTPKVSAIAGVSKTSVGRIRNRLVRRLKRRGECLPGCDPDGRRRVHVESQRYIPAEAVAALRERLLERWPVKRAALDLGVGLCSAYRIRDALRAELAARGKTLLPPVLPGRDRTASDRARWLPADRVRQFTQLTHAHGLAEAKRIILAEMAAEMSARVSKRMTFDEQLAAAKAGAKLTMRVDLVRPAPAMTLGGIATAAL